MGSLKPLLVYDSGCGACSSFKHLLYLLDVRGGLAFASIEEAEEGGLLEKVPDTLVRRSFHLILADGRILSGTEALPELMAALPFGSTVVPLWSSRLVAAALAAVYDAGARSHGQLFCRKTCGETHPGR